MSQGDKRAKEEMEVLEPRAVRELQYMVHTENTELSQPHLLYLTSASNQNQG